MRARSTPRLVRWALTVTLASLPGGCTPQKPPAPPPAPSPSPPVPPEETFALSHVRFLAEPSDPFVKLKVTYTVDNRLDRHAGGDLCFDLIDKDGYFITYPHRLDMVGLRARDSETVVDEVDLMEPELWDATAELRLYMSQSCFSPTHPPLSPAIFMDRSGRLLSAEARIEGKSSEVEGEDSPEIWFELKDARLVQNDRGEVMANYTLTNLKRGRASGFLCARLTHDAHCACQGLDQAETTKFNLGQGASVRKTSLLDLKDNAHWGPGQHVQLYMSTFGCTTPPQQANSNVLVIDKPRSIEAPPRPANPESDDD